MKRISKKIVTSEIFGEEFDKKIFQESGVFVIKKAIPIKVMMSIQKEWISFYTNLIKNDKGRTIDKSNSVNFKDELPESLKYFWKNKHIKKLSKLIIGKDVALYHHRIIMKDRKSNNKVFLHQDYSYHLGFHEKANLFIPLFDCGISDGALTFHLGSHQYGYLGDAGEIDTKKLNKWNKITPELKLGDVIVMNSLTWHESGENNSENDRVLFDIIIQPSYDPSGVDLINGKWKTDFWVNGRKGHDFEVDSLFINSRIKKIKNLQKDK